MAMQHEVVITGLGALTPLGPSVEASWRGLCEGRSGIRTVSAFDTEGLRTRVAGQVAGFDPADFIPGRTARRVDRFIQLGLAAARMAAAGAGLATEGNGPINGNAGERTAVVMGNCFGGALKLEGGCETVAAGGATRLSPYFIPGILGNTAAGMIAIELGATGPNLTVNEACASGAMAIGIGMQLIRSGKADTVIAGGCEAGLSKTIYCGYHSMRATTSRNHEPERASRPFDRDRDGFVPAEGAGVMVLESRESARRRGAAVLAEAAGFATTCDAYHPTHPHPSAESTARCLREALADAATSVSEVDCINAHGTSTQANDVTETRAIRAVFGNHAHRVPVTANKSMIGHTIGAAGAVEAIFSVLSLEHQVIPPTINLEHPDPECDLDYVPNAPRQAELGTVVSNSFGFGGINTSLVFRRPE